MNALDGITPYSYPVFPNILAILLFELTVVIVELFIFQVFWKTVLKTQDVFLNQTDTRSTKIVKEEDAYFTVFFAIIVGNIITFAIGYFIYIALGGT